MSHTRLNQSRYALSTVYDGSVIEPYDPDKDDSNFSKLYKAWNSYFGNIDKNVEDIKKQNTERTVSQSDDGAPFYPSQETLDFMKRSKQWEMQLELIANNTYGVLSPLHEIRQNTENMISNTSNVNNVNNNKNVQQPVNNTFNITMPNVTDSTSAASLMNDLQSLATKKYQVDW